jgi:hypothetical protein
MGEIGEAQRNQTGSCSFQPGKKNNKNKQGNVGGSSSCAPTSKPVQGEQLFKAIFLGVAVGLLFFMEEVKEFFVAPAPPASKN